MAKKRSGPALYEVLTRTPSGVAETPKCPSWSAVGERQAAEQVTGNVSDPPRAELAEPGALGRTKSGRAKAFVSPDTLRPEGRGAPLVALDGESITLSFTAKRAAVAIFAVIILVVVTFVSAVRFGERRYREGYAVGLDSTLAEAVDEIGEARRQPPATEAIQDLLKNAVGLTRETLEDKEQRTAAVGSSSWVLGNNYILVQHFGVGRSADARGAQDFLADRGIATETVRLGGGAIDLITTQGYNLKDRTQSQTAHQMLDVIHEAGVEYYAAGGGYKLEAYLKKLEKESW